VRGIGQIAHREEHVVAETPVQTFGSRESRRGEPDLERRLDALAIGIRKLEQRARLLAHEMAESPPQFVPGRHSEHATHAAAAWLMSRALDPQPGAAATGDPWPCSATRLIGREQAPVDREPPGLLILGPAPSRADC